MPDKLPIWKRLILRHPGLVMGLLWGTMMTILMTLYSAIFYWPLTPQDLALNVGIFGVAGGTFFGLGMKFMMQRRLKKRT